MLLAAVGNGRFFGGGMKICPNAKFDSGALDLVVVGDMTRLGVLGFNNAHTMEHYGNMVTYMRIRGVVPPSSEPRK